MATLTIEVSRDLLSLPPLVFSGADDDTPWGVTGYQEPARQSRVRYAESEHLDGALALSSRLQQAMLGWDAVPSAADEATLRNMFRELVDAIVGQFTYTVTVRINGAAADVWQGDPGSVTLPAGRNLTDLHGHDPVFQVTVPVYPHPGSA